VRTFCGQGGGGSSVADVCTFWRKKLRVFRTLWCVRTEKGLNHCGHFTDNGSQFFAISCGRLLRTAPKIFNIYSFSHNLSWQTCKSLSRNITTLPRSITTLSRNIATSGRLLACGRTSKFLCKMLSFYTLLRYP